MKETRTPGTGEWLLQNPGFQRWEETNPPVFSGFRDPVISGVGKTYLTSRVVDLIKDQMEDLPRNEGSAFFYCNRNEKNRRDSLSIINSYAEESGTTLSFDACQEQILALLNLYTKSTLVIEGFDECDQGSRDKLIETFNSLLAESNNTLKIYIASRPDPDIQAQIQQEQRISITIQVPMGITASPPDHTMQNRVE
ncbi:uncharacterized protein N7498_007900 [Penicillium cinerascens]|uniref:Nephrocystin 3-like N-terminal domain-containing protein n=1 Tax=Penicillium cinerascens TaxID=70096 RepID=A0A9W9JKW1_9EURO|nr:uncharacterized protein N7498_007900 [Penicillium cinerascens]KAJ5198783.1 hypothetical protein N7498_007900 [Penicillium cinerascens]